VAVVAAPSCDFSDLVLWPVVFGNQGDLIVNCQEATPLMIPIAIAPAICASIASLQ